MPVSRQGLNTADATIALIERFYLDLGGLRGQNPCFFNPDGGQALETLQEQAMFHLKRYKAAVAKAIAEANAVEGYCIECGGAKDGSIVHLTQCEGLDHRTVNEGDKLDGGRHQCHAHCEPANHCMTIGQHTVHSRAVPWIPTALPPLPVDEQAARAAIHADGGK